MGADIKAVARREIEEIFGQGNVALVDEIIATDFVGYDPAQPEPTRGREGVKQSAAGYRAAFPDLTCTVDQQVVEGDTVATRWTASGTHEGELFGIAPTGKQATVTGISISRIADGQIVEDYTNWDTFGLMVQIGVVPIPTTA